MSDPLTRQQVAAQLRQVLSQTDAGIARVENAAQAIGKAYDVLDAMTPGSCDVELLDAVNQFDAVRRQINDLLAVFGAARDAVQVYLDLLEADRPGMPVTPATVPTSLARPRQPLSVQHRDGSYYPANAAWAVDLLPRRVREGEEREQTVGRVVLAGTFFFGQMTSGRDGTWTPEIQRRLPALGIRVRMRLENHVEMKVAQMMINTGNPTGEVVINHVPCGVRPQQAIGCHQMLERYLPSGYTLTVHGTTQQGLPFSWSYRGQA